MNKPVLHTLAAVALALPIFNAAQAQTLPPPQVGSIIAATSATTTMFRYNNSPDYDISQAISQKGLNTTYVSGVTDYSSFTNSATHIGIGTGTYYSEKSTTTGSVTFGFGRSVEVDSFALWSVPQSSAVKDFSLYDSSNKLIGSFSAGQGVVDTGTTGLKAQVFNFGSVATTSVRMDILSNHGTFLTTGINEVAFRVGSPVTAVPEPGTYALMLAGLGAVGFIARRRHGARVA